ncbi:porin [Shewanella sp. NFH-SH190041]|uniref:porin n=1 Tax=Shewanella sp. NFH-SH190041 TaxID=2950245 RepID=UPI0021C4B810|nr:porin [Shewanella sp. NFH-SH190041]BDM65018.1 porin [Shewanella sp. NFH-SH190041]
MNKTIIATALAAIIAAPAASAAVQVYQDNTNQFTFGGQLDARLITDQSLKHSPNMVSKGTHVSFNFAHKMSDGWTASSVFDWGFDPFGGKGFTTTPKDQLDTGDSKIKLTSRLGYVALSNDMYGTISFGKQWGVWYDVVSGTDNAVIWGGSADGAYTFSNNGATNGVGRADRVIQYRNTIGDFSFAVQTQLQQDSVDLTAVNMDGNFGPVAPMNVTEAERKDENLLKAAKKQYDKYHLATIEYNNTYGMSASYTLMSDLQVVVGGNIGKFTSTYKDSSIGKSQRTDYIYGLGINYGNLSHEGLYVAANVNKNQWHQADVNGNMLPEAVGVEFYTAYNLGNGLRPYAVFNHLQSNEDYASKAGTVVESKMQYAAFGVAYSWDKNIFMYAEGKVDFSDYKTVKDGNVTKSEGKNGFGVGIRYKF